MTRKQTKPKRRDRRPTNGDAHAVPRCSPDAVRRSRPLIEFDAESEFQALIDELAEVMP
jgi:hypothetical protein